MKNFTLLIKRAALLFSLISFSAIFSQTTINYENFESGVFNFTYWNTGGVDCLLDTGGVLSGSNSANLQDDTGDTASMYSNDHDLTPYGSVVITFDFRTTGFNPNHDFFIEFSNDSGSTWNTTPIAIFIADIDFVNDTTYNDESVTINNGVTYPFNTTSRFRFRCDAQKDTDDLYLDEISVVGFPPPPEIDVTGNGISIADGDITPSATDDTDFGSVNSTGATNASTFTIYNTGVTNLILNGGSAPFVSVSGVNAGDFTITSPASSPITAGGNTTFEITFDPSADGLREATITINNNDTAPENVYTFDIEGTGFTPAPEMNMTGLGITIADGDAIPDVSDDTVFGSTSPGSPISKTYTIQNTGSATLTVGAISFAGANPGDFSVNTVPAATVAPAGSTTVIIDFDPTANGTRSAIISIANNDANENPYDFTVQGTGVIPLTEGPGGVTSDLALWLKGTDGLGYTDGDGVSLWADQGRGADATVNTAGQEPTYKDNATDNVNFNPVVDFDNTYSTFSLDGDFSYDDTSTQFLEGPSGYYSQDIFTVLIPDADATSSFGSMDIFCGDEDITTDNTDATGIGLGAYTVRFTNEVLTYCHGPTASGDGYGVAEVNTSATYDNAGIINVRNNIGASQQELYYNAINKETNQNDELDFANVNDARFWIGRSEGWEASTDARIAEVITYSLRKTDSDLTDHRNRIMSYLAIKYGITLGVNGTSQDYVNSNGDLIWDIDTGVPVNDVFNHDIAGIGRDDDSDLLQKQSRSVNKLIGQDPNPEPDQNEFYRSQGVLTMGISSIYDTNNLNPSSDLEDREFLVWGNNGVNLDDPAIVVDIDMSSGITPALTDTVDGGTMVQFNGIARTWKVVENVPSPGVDDIPTVEVAILQEAVRTATPPDGVYLMFISDSPDFGPTADFRVMSAGINELGESILTTNYDFDGTKYITFGWAPERKYTRSVYFNGTSDYIDMEDALNLNPTAFTISAWIKRDALDSGIASIVSKRGSAFTQGYDFRILNTNKLQFYIKNGTNQIHYSNTAIPNEEWHHVAITYDGSTVSIFIDGVLDNSAASTAPLSTTDSFFIGAAGKNAPTQFFMGNIDEVRIWDTNLSESQLRFIMNQEIEDNSNFVNGSYFITKGITPTKNDIATIPWSDLAGYYPLTTYTYTNTKDESGNGNRGALRNLRTVDRQTAPLPYKSTDNGDWDTDATWEYGSIQTKPGVASIVNSNITVDWNIVETNHNVTMDNSSLPTANNDNRNLLALSVETNEVELSGDNATNTGNALTISHFLSIDGKLDLEGDSQLIQSTDSDFDVTSAGTLEKDQQGTEDYFTYNYWSSPVGVSNTTSNNNSYTLGNNIFKDGTYASAPVNMNFVSGNNGANGTPISISTRWIYKYANLADDYYNWQHIRNTGTILSGEGFTMKGVDDTGGSVNLEQNYTIEGKPNNGSITLPIDNANDYLVGNPYASAIDANLFIADNTDTTGAIYLWEHFGGGTHITVGYQGGYAVYNLSGGVQAIQYDFVTGGTDPTGGTGTKTPGRYIPVAQGFFVIGTASGTINFNNSQRIFRKEDASSVFVRNSSSSTTMNRTDEVDDRLKIRLSFEATNTYKRQLLVTQDSQATNQIDFGYDAVNKDELSNDMFWMIDNEKFVIQGTNTIDESTILPVGITTTENGINTFKIDALDNVPSDLEIYIHDKTLDTYHNLRNSDYQIDLPSGEYLERFEITFTNQSLSVDDFEEMNTDVYYSNETNDIVINNPQNIEIDSVEIINMLGQVVIKYDNIDSNSTVKLKTKNLSIGTYIIKLKTEISEISKKVLVK